MESAIPRCYYCSIQIFFQNINYGLFACLNKFCCILATPADFPFSSAAATVIQESVIDLLLGAECSPELYFTITLMVKYR